MSRQGRLRSSSTKHSCALSPSRLSELQRYNSRYCPRPPVFFPAKACGLVCFANGKRRHPISSATYCFSRLILMCQQPVALFVLHVNHVVTSSPAVRAQSCSHLSVSIYALAAAIRLAAEPLYISAQNESPVNCAYTWKAAPFSYQLLSHFSALPSCRVCGYSSPLPHGRLHMPSLRSLCFGRSVEAQRGIF